jgi:hypothetical protein
MVEIVDRARAVVSLDVEQVVGAGPEPRVVGQDVTPELEVVGAGGDAQFLER